MKIYDKQERPWTHGRYPRRSCSFPALSASELLTAAHRSLGYTIPPQPSPHSEDSLGVLWRSMSAAVVDIPDLPPTPVRATPARRASAPSVLKASPPSPLSSRAYPTTSPAWSSRGDQQTTPTQSSRVQLPGAPSPSRPPLLPISGRRLADAVNGVLVPPTCATGVLVPPTSLTTGSEGKSLAGPIRRRRRYTAYAPQIRATPYPSSRPRVKPLSLRSRLLVARDSHLA